MQLAGVLHGPAHSAMSQAQAFTRSVDLDSSRLYSRVQCGHIRLALGGHPEAVAAFEAALEQRPGFGPACEGAAAALLAAARSHQSSGAPGRPSTMLDLVMRAILQLSGQARWLHADIIAQAKDRPVQPAPADFFKHYHCPVEKNSGCRSQSMPRTTSLLHPPLSAMQDLCYVQAWLQMIWRGLRHLCTSRCLEPPASLKQA